MKLARIEWLDIQSFDGPWMDLAEAKGMKPVAMETIGWLIEITDTHVVICSTRSEDGDVGSVNSIPRGVICSYSSLLPMVDEKPMECDGESCDDCGCLKQKSESL